MKHRQVGGDAPKGSGNQYFELLKVGGNAPKYSPYNIVSTFQSGTVAIAVIIDTLPATF